MSPEEFIRDQFLKSGLDSPTIRILCYSEESFGNFVAEVQTKIGLLRVERERGQSFIDFFDDKSNTFIRGDIKWPELLQVFKREKWDLAELLEVIATKGAIDGP